MSKTEEEEDCRRPTTTAAAIVPFNGGKMNHIWTPGKGRYESTFANAAAERCFANPRTIISLKVHGECAVLLKTPIVPQPSSAAALEQEEDRQPPPAKTLYEWTFATRYDTRGKKDPPAGAIPLPVWSTTGMMIGSQPAVYGDHHYWLLPLDPNLIVGKGQKKTYVGRDTYGAIAAGVASGDIPDPNDSIAPPFLSVEWVGRKHQGNVDCIDADHAICVHGSTVLSHLLPLPRSLSQVEALAQTESIEGLVLYDPDTSERFKIRFDMVMPDHTAKFAQHCQMSTPYTAATTSIKPKAIIAMFADNEDVLVGSSSS
jgi:hypothetical protein